MNTNEEKMNENELSDEELSTVTGGANVIAIVKLLGTDLTTRKEFKKAYAAYLEKDLVSFCRELNDLIKQGNSIAKKIKAFL